ncbi:MAG: exosortase system-associated protein, TIGR04073 family [Verrucomicrobia bacterium]|nr:exosortase system-associated protein, TIGR04073 family [Verrucomicrobiota bacterium]
MRSKFSVFAMAAFVALLGTACKGPEKKLGRGITNLTEFGRGGELRRSVEQTALWDGPSAAYTTGVIHGINRSLVRTVVGAFEIATFPFPSYDPYLKPGNPILPDASVDPVYPASYAPNLLSDSTFEPDAALGFTGGDIFPFIPGSRFRIFDY